MDDAGLEAGLFAGEEDHVADGVADRGHHPVVGGQGGEVYRRGGSGRVSWREDRDEGLGVQGSEGEAVVVGGTRGASVVDGDGQVDLAVEELGEGLMALGVLDDEAEAGGGFAEAGQRRCDQQADRGGEGGDAELAVGAVGVQAHRVLGAFDLGEDRVGVGEQQTAGRGDRDPAAAAFQQFLADLGLEGGQLLGDGGRREVQDLGGRRHGAVVSKGPQYSQPAHFDHGDQLRTRSHAGAGPSGSASAEDGGAGRTAGRVRWADRSGTRGGSSRSRSRGRRTRWFLSSLRR
ncbi:hypothetical protein GCM10027269_08210 [Kribbella endophytica]